MGCHQAVEIFRVITELLDCKFSFFHKRIKIIRAVDVDLHAEMNEAQKK